MPQRWPVDPLFGRLHAERRLRPGRLRTMLRPDLARITVPRQRPELVARGPAKQPLKKPDAYFWPDQVLKDAVACLAVLVVVLLLCIHFDVQGLLAGNLPPEHRGAELGAPADASNRYNAARPEWYFLFLFQFLKYFPGHWEIVGAIVIPAVVMLVFFMMPILGRVKAELAGALPAIVCRSGSSLVVHRQPSRSGRGGSSQMTRTACRMPVPVS